MIASRTRNPYVAGRPLGQEHGFFGRQEALRTVENELRSPERNTVVIFGPRRIGKTSLLLQLQRTLPSPSFLPVYFDLIGCARKPLSRVLFELASAIAQEVGTRTPDPHDFDQEGAFFRRQFLADLYRQLGEECRPVLLLDQFDMLDVGGEDHGDAAAGPLPFLSYLRQLLDQEERLGFVIVVGHVSAEGLSTEIRAIFKGARYERISVLEPDSAAGLVRLADAQGSLSFDGAAVDRILALTGGHPYFIQLLCQILWKRAYAEPPQDVPQVDVAAVDDAVVRANEAGESGLSWIWDGLPAAERLVLSAMAQLGDGRQVVSREQMAQILKRYSSSLRLGEPDLLPGTLPRAVTDGELLREAEGGFRIEVELMRRWIAARRPPGAVRDELERMNPLAVTLYESGKGLYRHGDFAASADLLRHVLRIHPGHIKARLLLGKVLLQQGQLAEAVEVTEEAYRYDQDLAREPLVQLLLMRADELDRGGDPSSALETYRRALDIAPQEAAAREGSAAIWRRRGAEALEMGDLDRAEEAYRTGGAADKVAEVAGLRAKRERERVAGEAQKHVWEEEWAQAAALYQLLTDEDPEEPRWQQGLSRARAELDLSEKYAAARHAHEEGDWQQAVRALAAVIAVRHDYKDAAELLTEAFAMHQGGAAVPVTQPVPAPQPAGRRLAWPLVLAAGLCLGGMSSLAVKVRAGAVPAPPPVRTQPVDIDTQLARGLASVEAALKGRRWNDAIRKCEMLLKMSGVSPLLRDAVAARKTQAEQERYAQPAYERFVSAAGDSKDYDELLRLYRDIPAQSGYGKLAAETYYDLFPQFATQHLRRAEAARAAGHCSEFQDIVRLVLAIEPHYETALSALARPCREQRRQAVAAAPADQGEPR